MDGDLIKKCKDDIDVIRNYLKFAYKVIKKRTITKTKEAWIEL